MKTNNFLFFVAALFLGSHVLAPTAGEASARQTSKGARSAQTRSRAMLPRAPQQKSPRRSSLKSSDAKTQKHVAISPIVAIRRYDPSESPQDTARRANQPKLPRIQAGKTPTKPRWAF